MLIIANWKNRVPMSSDGKETRIWRYLHKLRNHKIILAPHIMYTSLVSETLRGSFPINVFFLLLLSFFIGYVITFPLIAISLEVMNRFFNVAIGNESFALRTVVAPLFFAPITASIYVIFRFRRYIFRSIRRVHLAAQDISHTSDTLTGEGSADNLSLMDVKYCIVGHAERRRELKESRERVYMKIDRIVSAGVIPIICSDESHIEKDIEIMKEISGEFIVAYEPEDSIGGEPVNRDSISDFIFKVKTKLGNAKVVYGGGVDERNISSLIVDGLDGFMLGRVSLSAAKMKKILKEIK